MKAPKGKQEELPMHDWTSLSYERWDCKCRMVFVPKHRAKRLYGKFRNRGGKILRDLCRQRGVELVERHIRSTGVPCKAKTGQDFIDAMSIAIIWMLVVLLVDSLWFST